MLSANDYASPYPNPFEKHCDGCGVILTGDLRPFRRQDTSGPAFLLCLDCQQEHSCAYCGDYSASLKTLSWDIPGTWNQPPDNGTMDVCPACFEQFERNRKGVLA